MTCMTITSILFIKEINFFEEVNFFGIFYKPREYGDKE